MNCWIKIVAIILILSIFGCNDADNGNYASTCKVGEYSCNGDDVVQCDDNEEWIFVKTCSFGCVNGRCQQQTTDGDLDNTESEVNENIEQDLDSGEADFESNELDLSDCDLEKEFDEGSTNIDGDAEGSSESEEAEAEIEFISEECTPDIYNDGNFDRNTAVNLELPFSSKELSICEPDWDWYLVTIPAYHSLHALARYEGFEGLVHLVLYEKDYQDTYDWVQTVWSEPDQSELVYTSTSDKEYLLVVWRKYLPLNNYWLDVWTQEADSNPNGNSCDNAIPISANETVTGETYTFFDSTQSDCSDSFGSDVVYKLNWLGNANARIKLSSDFDSVLFIRRNCSSASSEIGCADEYYYDSTEELFIENLDSGNYFIWIDGASNTESGQYTLQVISEVKR